MKKKILCLLLVAGLFVTGCASSKAPEADADANAPEAQETVEEDVPEEEPQTGMGNPWRDTTEEEATESLPRRFTTPEGATNVVWRIMDQTGKEEDINYPLVETKFDIDGGSFCARGKYGAAEDEDISGMYYEWTEKESVTLTEWGGGNMPATLYGFENESEKALMVTWYDIEIGIAYSLSTDSFGPGEYDILALADAIHVPEDFMPSSFLEEKAGKGAFESEEEILSYLEKGQGYAYVELTGSDEKVLGVSGEIYEKDGKNVGAEICLYGERDGKYINLGNAYAYDEQHPLQCADGVIVCNSDEMYEEDFLSADEGYVMVKAYLYKSEDENGKTVYGGFIREDNSFDESKEQEVPEDGADIFDKYTKSATDIPVIEFTVVE